MSGPAPRSCALVRAGREDGCFGIVCTPCQEAWNAEIRAADHNGRLWKAARDAGKAAMDALQPLWNDEYLTAVGEGRDAELEAVTALLEEARAWVFAECGCSRCSAPGGQEAKAKDLRDRIEAQLKRLARS